MQNSLREIQVEIERLAAKIDAPLATLPTYGYTIDGAHPHIEVDSRGYHYVCVERGQEEFRLTTLELDTLLEEVFKGVVCTMAGRYELDHRVKEQDCRRMMFARQLELLAILSPEWAERESLRISKILADYPYDDMISLRVDLYVELRGKGYSVKEATRISEERFPPIEGPRGK